MFTRFGVLPVALEGESFDRCSHIDATRDGTISIGIVGLEVISDRMAVFSAGPNDSLRGPVRLDRLLERRRRSCDELVTTSDSDRALLSQTDVRERYETRDARRHYRLVLGALDREEDRLRLQPNSSRTRHYPWSMERLESELVARILIFGVMFPAYFSAHRVTNAP